MQVTSTAIGQPLTQHAHIFPRQVALHFQCGILGPLCQNLKGYQPSFYNYGEALLSHAGIPVNPAYAQGFFTPKHFKSIYMGESWAMSPGTQHLVSLSTKTFNVYSMLQCFPIFHSHPQLLPAPDIKVMQAKSIAVILFAMINMELDFATSTTPNGFLLFLPFLGPGSNGVFILVSSCVFLSPQAGLVCGVSVTAHTVVAPNSMHNSLDLNQSSSPLRS
jgi:hypothetical protein